MKSSILLMLIGAFILLVCSLVSAQEIDSECKTIEDVIERGDCYYNLARTITDFNDCGKLHARGVCYDRFINAADDCSKIEDWDSVNRDYCYLRFAFEYNQAIIYPENCEKIQTTALRGKCYYGVAEHGYEYKIPDTAKYCDMITYTQETECFDDLPDSIQRMCVNLKKTKDKCYELVGEHAKYITHSGLAKNLILAAIIAFVVWTGVLLAGVKIYRTKFLSNFIFEIIGIILGSVFFTIFIMVFTKIWNFAMFISSAFLYFSLILQNLFGAREGYPVTKFTNPILTAFLLISFWILFILVLKHFITNWQIRKFKIFTILLIVAVAVLNFFFFFVAYASSIG